MARIFSRVVGVVATALAFSPLLVTLVSGVVPHPSDANESSGPIVLSDASFNDFIDSERPVLVEFYAPWCGFCKKFAPQYELAAKELSKSSISLGQIDCVANLASCQAQQIHEYPTLKVFTKKEAKDYTGPRDAEGVIRYMKKLVAPVLVEVEGSVSAIEAAIKDEPVAVIAFLTESNDTERAVFAELAEKLRIQFAFFVAKNPSADVLGKWHVKTPGVVVLKTFDDPVVIHTDSFTLESLENFVITQSFPIMDDISQENYMRYVESKKPLLFFFWENAAQRGTYKDIIEPLARKFRGAVNFVYIDAQKYGEYAKSLNLDGSRWPAIAIHKIEEDLKYPYKQDSPIDSENVEAFLDRFVKGVEQPFLKSEPIPEKNDAPVKVVVNKSFEQIVMDKNKDVLLEMYAHWCGACKRLAPIYDDLATKLVHVDSLVIAKIDAQANDLPPSLPFRIEAYPTIKLFVAGTKEVISYEGGYSVTDFVAFLKKSVTHKFEYEMPADQHPAAQEEAVEHEEQEGHDEL